MTEKKIMFHLPSPIHEIRLKVFQQSGIQVLLKREDLIHPVVSGNKSRKLKYHLLEISEAKQKGFFTFGGPFSNHLLAAAWMGKEHQLDTVGFIRGEEADLDNPTLRESRKLDMTLIPISREAYARKNDPAFLAEISGDYPDLRPVPEGGSGAAGVRGCTEILQEVNQPYDFVCCPLGTGTTFAGLIAATPLSAQLLGFPAIAGGHYLKNEVETALSQFFDSYSQFAKSELPFWSLNHDYAFGGFGKMNADLVAFMNQFWEETGIPLDPIYTGKMMYGLVDLAAKGYFPKGSTVLAIHTGGLQGIEGMNARLKKQGLRISYP